MKNMKKRKPGDSLIQRRTEAVVRGELEVKLGCNLEISPPNASQIARPEIGWLL